MNSIRSYTDKEVSPLFEESLKESFVPEVVPAFAARSVFEGLMAETSDFKGYRYKDAVLNPTSPKDQADAFETSLVEKWKSMPSATKEMTGYRQGPNGSSFYISRPTQITKESCLVCHSTPDKAPPSMVELYGDKSGFNWPLNEVIGTQIVEIPASGIRKTSRQSFLIVMGLFLILFTTSIFALNTWLKQHIIRPIKPISQAAEAVSVGNLEVELIQRNKDEVGLLTASFERMRTSIAIRFKRS